jgi:hypothetical protein
LVIGAAAAALAVGGGAAIAAGAGGLPGDGDDRRADLARELAERLDGDATAAEIERALADIEPEPRAEHETALARALAAELDGVDVESARAALAAAREAAERGRHPDRDVFVTTLAERLGVTAEQVRSALRSAHPGGPGMARRWSGPHGPGGPPPVIPGPRMP